MTRLDGQEKGHVQTVRTTGWGSVLVEPQLAWYDLPHQIEELDDLFVSAAARDTLGPVNPLAQVPTLVLPGGGQVMRCVWVCGGGSG